MKYRFDKEPAAPKNYTDGTHRTRDPAETYRFISQHFSTTGITRIADVTGLDTIGIPVCVAVRPNSKSLSVSQGKGAKLILAKTSAAMEAIELYHAENITLPITTGSYRELVQIANVCDPQRLNLHPYANYQAELRLPWVAGFDLIQRKKVFVPYELVHCSLLTKDIGQPIFAVSSTGLASGNHFLEATSHAICEVIERDATHLWRLKMNNPNFRANHLNLDTVDSPSCRELITKLKQAGVITYVWDLTTDVGAPVFGCVILEEQSTMSLLPIGVFHGFGCHLSKEVALSRALTEAVQCRLTYISGARDDVYREIYEISQSGYHRAQWQRPFTNVQPAVDYRQLPSRETDSLDGDIFNQLSLLKQAGFPQVIVVDLTQPQLGIPVVRVIIPGMNHSAEGFMTKLSQRAKDYLSQELLIHQLLTGNFSYTTGKVSSQ